MSKYRRLISYIYAYEGGVKGKNVGYAKIEVRGGQCKVGVNVKKVYVGSNEIGVYLLAGDQEVYLGNIFIRNGSGEFRALFNAENIEGNGLSMDNCHGLTIHDVESTWQAYTTIWEDAVAHAAEIELADITAENRIRQKEQLERQSKTTVGAEDVAAQAVEAQAVAGAAGGTTGQQSGTTGQQTGTTGQQIGAAGQQNGTASQQNGTASQQNGTAGQQTGTAGQQTGTAGQQTGTAGQQTGTEGQQTGTAGQQTGTAGQQTGTAGQQNGMMGQQNSMMGRRNGMTGRQTGMTGRQTGMTGRQTGTMGQQPGTMGRQTGTMGRQPGTMGRQPGTMGQQPATNGWQNATPGPQNNAAGRQEQDWQTRQEQENESQEAELENYYQENIGNVPRYPIETGGIQAEPSYEGTPEIIQENHSSLPLEQVPQSALEEPFEEPTPVPDPPESDSPEPYRQTRRPRIMEMSGSSLPEPGDAAVLEALERQEQEETNSDTAWNTFQRRFPKLRAFDYENGCEIISIRPQDLGLLPREVWVYGNNSFLLHGYYNYRYLILAKLENPEGSPRYLLGVPGHYYSNEKYMASMFGFPSFVLSKQQPQQDGRFGYWYTDIRI